MVKDLLVKISASIAGLKKGLSEAVTVTQTASNKIDQSAKNISSSLNQAFTGDYRKNINDINSSIQQQKDNILDLNRQLNEQISGLRRYKKGSESFNQAQRLIKKTRAELRFANGELAELNAKLRDQKTNLAQSRLAAEDNSSAMEALSRVTTSLTGALLLLGDGNEKLQPIMKGVRISVAALNAVVAIQNLRLRENAQFLSIANSAFQRFSKLVASSSFSMSLLKNALTSLALTAVVIGIKLLYDSFVNLNTGINDANKSLRLNKKDLDEVSKEYGKSIAEVERYIQVISDQTINENDRIDALKSLKKEYPQYAKFLTSDINNTNSLISAKKKIIELLAKEAIFKAAQNKLEKLSEQATNKYLVAVNNTKRILQDRAAIQKQLNDQNGEAAKNGFIRENLEFRLGYIQERINKNDRDKIEALKEINELTAGLNKLQKELGLDFDFTDYSATEKKEKNRLKTFTNNQQEIAIAEIKYNRDRLLFLAKTEEEKANIINGAEKQILDIRKQYFIQNATAQGLSQEQSELAWIQYKNDLYNAEVDGNKRIKDARNKDFDDLLGIEESKQLAIKEAFEGTLAVYERAYERQKDEAAKAYNNGEIDLEEYHKRLQDIEYKGLQERKGIYEDFGIEASGIEQKIAEINIQRQKEGLKKLTQQQKDFIKNTNRVFRNAFTGLFNDIGQVLQDSFMRAIKGTDEAAKISLKMLELKQKELEQVMNDARSSEMEILQARQQYLQNQEQIAEQSKDNLTKTFDSMLMAVGDFLVKLGSGLVAAAVASKAFQDLLVVNPVAAIAAGAAAVALGTIVKATLTEGVAFAQGGIVSGPTLGLVGEYPGASTNPEVIAPLNKLKSMLDLGGNSNEGYIAETRVSGRDLSIVLSRYNNDAKRG